MIKLKDFQTDAIKTLVSLLNDKKKKEIVMQSPTGSGKTVMLAYAIRDFLNTDTGNHCFFWFSPGNGELEEQSKGKFEYFVPEYNALTLNEALRDGFGKKQIVFVNWEMLDKKDNKALRVQENKNLQDRIEECHDAGTEIIIIRDESHTHNTKIAEEIIKLFGNPKTVNVSATINKKIHPVIDVEITEQDVIRSGLITKLISINEGLKDIKVIGNYEEDVLLQLAINKQKEIAAGYRTEGLDLVPLIIIQYPNESPNKDLQASSAQLMARVEKFIAREGYTYENGLAACWLDGNKKNIGPDNQPLKDVVFLHTKQALATGWDCPRAKILVKLRDNMNTTFEIQVLGRIRRMPEQKHYDNEVLNNCYLYTFDEKYKAEAIAEYGGKEAAVLYLKDEYVDLDLGLTSVLRPKNSDSKLNDREKAREIRNYIIAKYDLETILKKNPDKSGYTRNKAKLEKINDEGYIFEDRIQLTTYEGTYALSEDVTMSNINNITLSQDANHDTIVKRYSNAIRTIAEQTNVAYPIVRNVAEWLFLGKRIGKRSGNNIGRVLGLSKDEYRIFIINNRERLSKDIRESRVSIAQQRLAFDETLPTVPFMFPAKEIVYLNPAVHNPVTYKDNVYDNYKSDIIRSIPEKRFERELSKSKQIKWFYKNGDKGPKYFSIAFRDNHGSLHLFYPDYIVMTKDNRLFIIEIKGGESSDGSNRNIDEISAMKFNALKKFVEDNNTPDREYPLNFAFIRDTETVTDLGTKTYDLFYSNTVWTDELGSEWKPFGALF